MFEVNTIYTGGSVAEFAEPWETMVKPMLSEFGAQSPTAWEALTGTFAGATAISTRWDSLQAIGKWLSEMPSKLAAATALADVAASSTLAVRVVGKDVLEHGNPEGPFLSASRYSFTAPLSVRVG